MRFDKDVLDSRTLEERINDLEQTEDRDEYDQEELDSLIALRSEIQGYSREWYYGITFIRDSYFEEYARELAEDIGAVERDRGWPYDYIDWERAADALKMDYTSVEFEGEDYWYR